MKTTSILVLIISFSINLFAQTKTNKPISNFPTKNMKPIHHVLIFNLKNEISETDQQSFFAGMKALETISGISNFELTKPINANTKFKNVLMMDFDSDESFQAYIKNPQNQDFVKNYWLKMVDDYLVIDTEKKK
jgi:heme-degrading monooxygenase HmoA